jgi:dolichol-phosphate mannosyltransferase
MRVTSMDGPHAHRLSLVLPAFNEEAGIRQAVVEADEALARLTSDYEILVVDDGSCDDTAAIVDADDRTADAPAPPRGQLRLCAHRLHGGAFERVAFTDADCQFH